MSTRSISGGKGGRCVRLTTYHHPVPLSRNLGTLTFWNPLGHSRPVTGLLLLMDTNTTFVSCHHIRDVNPDVHHCVHKVFVCVYYSAIHAYLYLMIYALQIFYHACHIISLHLLPTVLGKQQKLWSAPFLMPSYQNLEGSMSPRVFSFSFDIQRTVHHDIFL